MKAKIKRMLRKVISPIRRIGLKNKKFTIISNNCWGGCCYDIFGLKYLSPTIGLFFMSSDYIKFVSSIEEYLSKPLIQIFKNQSKHYDYIKDKLTDDCVIGLLGDIEIFFLHYSSFDAAKQKFEKRKLRIDYDNILIKYSDQNLFSYKDFEKFENIKFKNKLFITTNKNIKSDSVKIVYIEDKWNCGFAKDDIKPSLKRIKLKELLNNIGSFNKKIN